MSTKKCTIDFKNLIKTRPQTGVHCQAGRTSRGYRDQVIVEKKDISYYVYKCPIARVQRRKKKYMMIQNCGHYTKLVKDRFNEILPKDYAIFQRDWRWYVWTPKGNILFKNRMRIPL